VTPWKSFSPFYPTFFKSWIEVSGLDRETVEKHRRWEEEERRRVQELNRDSERSRENQLQRNRNRGIKSPLDFCNI